MIKTQTINLNIRFDQIDKRFNKVEVDIAEVKDEVGGLKADLVDTVSKKEHNKLKAKVDKYLVD